MKLNLKNWAAALVMVLPLTLIQFSQSEAAGSPTFSSLNKITQQAMADAHASEAGEVCVNVDSFGVHTDITSLSMPPKDYSGNHGDLWLYLERFELSFYNYKFLYWDGSIWLDGTGLDENGDASEINSSASWNQYATDHMVMTQEAKESINGYQCKFSNLTSTEIVGRDPSAKHIGAVGDYYIKIDSKFRDARLYFAWSGTKWIGWLENPYTLAHAAALRTKEGEFCTYGKNKDVYSSFYSVPPANYKGVKGDLWIVADKITGEPVNAATNNYYWDGKSWIPDAALTGWESLKKLNDEAQFKARSSATGEICHAGTNTSTQVVSAKLPSNYKGKINDRWIYMDKVNATAFVSMYYWNGKSWIQD